MAERGVLSAVVICVLQEAIFLPIIIFNGRIMKAELTDGAPTGTEPVRMEATRNL